MLPTKLGKLNKNKQLRNKKVVAQLCLHGDLLLLIYTHMKKTFIIASMITMLASCMGGGEKYYEKHAVIPDSATAEEIADIAARVGPTRNQLEWLQMELRAFLH